MKSQNSHADGVMIATEADLSEFCRYLAGVPQIGFDTEFVSEDTYGSHLCLVQVATHDRLAIIDPLDVPDLTEFWRVLAHGEHETIVHAGREELVFSLTSVGRRPARLFDIQIAAGLVGLDYPAGYGSLVNNLLGHRPGKGETRTDWRRRPLTKHQLEYALNDVRYLLPMRNKLWQTLDSLNRLPWLEAEMEAWQAEVEGYQTRPRWRKVSGISGLSGRGLAIVRELWQWRDAEAQRRNRPPKRVLRDDLIIEIAKRASDDPKRILAIRGIEQSGLRRFAADLAACVSRALKAPEPVQPRSSTADMPNQLSLLGQVLTSALTSTCRQARIAPSIVGTASDVRDLIAYRLGFGAAADGEPPKLAKGWRAEVVGNVLDDLLAGKTSIRIHNPLSDDPLEFIKGANPKK